MPVAKEVYELRAEHIRSPVRIGQGLPEPRL